MADEHDSWLKSALGVDVGDTLQKIEDAGSSAISSATSTVASAASTALDAANSAGNAVMSAESTAWDGTKKAYGAVTGAYDAVAPNFTKANQDLGNLVDAGEAAVKKGNEMAAAQYGDVPVVGSVVKASSWVGNMTADALGGVVKGVGDLTTMAANAVVHPIDSAVSMGEGALGIAEHVPLVPGMNTTVNRSGTRKDGRRVRRQPV